MAKPDPAVFKSTLKRLETLPQEAIFIDDTIGHVKAARSLGIHGILYSQSERLRLELNRLLRAQSKGAANLILINNMLSVKVD
jgi:FMN phosphatase YigB (HAD superfamily)